MYGAYERYAVLLAATTVSISCGLNYCYSAYAPQLANRLALSSTQSNVIGAAGNMGVYLSSPLIGRIVDRRGPIPTLILAAVTLPGGYLAIRAFYAGGPDPDQLFARVGVPGLVLAQFLTGVGSTAGLSSAGNSVARTFRKRRAAALSVVLSAFGLSAFFYSTLSAIFLHSRAGLDVTPAFLLLLSMGSLFSTVIGLLFVRPVPPLEAPPTSIAPSTQAASPGGTAEEATTEIDAPFAAEAEDQQAEQTAAASRPDERTPLLRSDSTKSVQERNISGWALFQELDFYLIFLFNGLCAGVGLCFINNLGTIVRSLALASPDYTSATDDARSLSTPASIALLQSRLVSLLSLFNCFGRLLSGFLSDHLLHHPNSRMRTPRVAFLPWTATLFLASQVVALSTTQPSRLWLATSLTGLAHGSLFGISGIVGLERFGLKSFSQTNGVLALAPALFGQTTNLVFGRIYDAHVGDSRLTANLLKAAGTCTGGRTCYAPALVLTSGMALAAVGVGTWLAVGRKGMRVRAA